LIPPGIDNGIPKVHFRIVKITVENHIQIVEIFRKKSGLNSSSIWKIIKLAFEGGNYPSNGQVVVVT
jgi:hypothetical protein